VDFIHPLNQTARKWKVFSTRSGARPNSATVSEMAVQLLSGGGIGGTDLKAAVLVNHLSFYSLSGDWADGS
jgi:hypothetical protein